MPSVGGSDSDASDHNDYEEERMARVTRNNKLLQALIDKKKKLQLSLLTASANGVEGHLRASSSQQPTRKRKVMHFLLVIKICAW